MDGQIYRSMAYQPHEPLFLMESGDGVLIPVPAWACPCSPTELRPVLYIGGRLFCAECERRKMVAAHDSAAAREKRQQGGQEALSSYPQIVAAALAQSGHAELVSQTVCAPQLGEIGVESLDEGHYFPRPQAGKRYRGKAASEAGSFRRQQRRERWFAWLTVAAVVVGIGALFVMGWLMRSNTERMERDLRNVEVRK